MGTAFVPSGGAADGSITVDLLRDGVRVDGAQAPLACGAGATCPWAVSFATVAIASHEWTVRAYRHVQGSVCGGEAALDLNAPGCREALVAEFGLPPDYEFSLTDWHDSNYVSRPGATTSVECLVVMRICAP
jgi:hypothetical protein